jgi:hypothetical protein
MIEGITLGACASRYGHRVAISSRRLVAADDAGIACRWKGYRINGMADNAASPAQVHHDLPKGSYRIRPSGSRFRGARPL